MFRGPSDSEFEVSISGGIEPRNLATQLDATQADAKGLSSSSYPRDYENLVP